MTRADVVAIAQQELCAVHVSARTAAGVRQFEINSSIRHRKSDVLTRPRVLETSVDAAAERISEEECMDVRARQGDVVVFLQRVA